MIIKRIKNLLSLTKKTLPYIQGISEKIARSLSQFNIIVAHKPAITRPQDLSTGKINFKDCDKVYIGQTSRALRSRTREHKRVIFTGDKNSLLKGKYGLEKVSLNRTFFTCIVILDHSFGLNVFK